MTGSHIPPLYSSRRYFVDPQRGRDDARVKAASVGPLLVKAARKHRWPLSSYVDVGCGSGDIVTLIAGQLRDAKFVLDVVKGYDVSPHVSELRRDGVEFVHGDFCDSEEHVDVVTLFDVVEHVPDPVSFLKAVSARCKVVALHIPLDRSINTGMRDLFHAKLEDPGHLIFLDAAGALNLVTLAGLLTIDYDFTRAFNASSGHDTAASKIARPLRQALFNMSPWLLSRTFGGVSLAVLAVTPEGMNTLPL